MSKGKIIVILAVLALILAVVVRQQASTDYSNHEPTDLKAAHPKGGVKEDVPPVVTTASSSTIRNTTFAARRSVDTVEKERRQALRKREADAIEMDRAWREKVQAMDKKRGVNAEVRQREAELREKSGWLHKGMSQEKAWELLGAPSTVGITMERKMWDRANGNPKTAVSQALLPLSDTGAVRTTKYLSQSEIGQLPILPPDDLETVFLYSPHSTGKSYDSFGDSFQILQLWFENQDGTLIAWRWSTPGVIIF